ncbi:MAG: tetratricopeptide repeat protein [Lachnospiraceae bacterium]|nr:tetratricopeptide repeat protein [Lachnospiraceae bacterium]
MECKNCGFPLDDGVLVCPRCGTEVQLVSDYQVFGDFLDQHLGKNDKKRKNPDPVTQHNGPEEIYRVSRMRRAEQKKQKKRRIRLAILITFVVAAATIYGVLQLNIRYQNESSYDYQMKRAETAYADQKYDQAYERVQKAIGLEAEDADAWLLKARILIEQRETDKAISALQKIIGLYPNNASAYELLIQIYEGKKDTDAIKSLLSDSSDKGIRAQFADYISDMPKSDLKEGEYDDYQTFSLSSEEGSVIYYTLDGSIPDEKSQVFDKKIRLDNEGVTVVQAIAVNQKGISSDIAQFTYTIAFPVPDPPKISPSSGEFIQGMDAEIQIIVPDGCKAYYSFDQMPTSETGTRYTGEPIPMPEGEHTFYAILVNSQGKSSYAASETYSYSR